MTHTKESPEYPGRFNQWLVQRGIVAAQIDFVTSDERWADGVNHPTLRMGGYTNVNLRLSYGPEQGRWQLAVFVRNLTDREQIVAAHTLAGFFGMAPRLYHTPRQVGATVSFRSS